MKEIIIVIIIIVHMNDTWMVYLYYVTLNGAMLLGRQEWAECFLEVGALRTRNVQAREMSLS